MLAANGLAGGKIGKVSREYDNKIVPDGWAFAIWGLIYALLAGFVVYVPEGEHQVVLPADSGGEVHL